MSEQPHEDAAGSWARLARAQHRGPWRFLAGAVLLTAASFPLLLQLELDSDFQAMLPESAPSVRALDEIRSRFSGTSTLTLALHEESAQPDLPALRELARALAPRIEAMGELEVMAVDWNVADFERFVEERRHLYADLEALEEIRDALRDRLEWERARADPHFVDLGDDEPPDPEQVIARTERHAQAARAATDRFPEGFYQHPERPIVFLFVRTSIRGGESGPIERLIAAVEREADAIRGEPADASRTAGTSAGWESGAMRIDYGGDLMAVHEENEALEDAVQRSTILTLTLVFASIYVFFARRRAVPLLAVSLLAPTIVSFGVAELAVDHLTASSAFIGSIIVGNGVNPNIMWLGRYFEERRAGRDVASALRATHEGTWAGTLAATVAAGLAYGSLMVTDCRGFRDFGLIGALGMSMCWVGAYTVLPALVTVSERWRPMVFGEREKRLEGACSVLVARLALGSPRVVLALCVVLTVFSSVATGVAIAGDPLEYDLRNLQVERGEESRVSQVNAWTGETVEETRTGSALAMLAPRREDVGPLREQLERYRENHPGVLGAIRTLDDLVPADQEAKLPVLAELHQLVLDVRPHLVEAQQRRAGEWLPPARIDMVRLEDLPASVARPFVERDGTLGRLLLVERADGQSTWDGRYMIRWSEAVRSARTESGASPAIAGVPVVFADLLRTIFEDGPKAIGASFLATAMLLLFTFRRQRERTLALVSMFAGVTWMTGLLVASGTRLGFLNMIAFPITFGIGVEYGVSYLKRFQQEKDARGGDGSGAARAALEGAGGAVILCSLTTLIGYVSLYTSSSRALSSFGLAMSLGEVTCAVSSLLALPAVLHLLEMRAATKRKAAG